MARRKAFMDDQDRRDLRTLENLIFESRLLDKKIEALKEKLTPRMPSDSVIETDDGTFSIVERPKWRYSVETRALDEDIKARKKREEADGTATRIEGSRFIQYREKKEEE